MFIHSLIHSFAYPPIIYSEEASVTNSVTSMKDHVVLQIDDLSELRLSVSVHSQMVESHIHNNKGLGFFSCSK